ncbi:MAG TPA: T9SS type A sorting domain-containing protein [Chitinophagaceae bacterium]|nr:T9SS type A sorting domain-containing protein [Chitinophagaceae bacterium]
MKQFLLSIFLLSSALISFKNVNAQCDLKFPNLARVFSADIVSLGPNKCQYTVGVGFEIVTNSGFKNLFFHSWLSQDYPNPSIFDCSGGTPARDPGTSLQLGTAIDDPGKSFNDIGFVGLNELTFAPGVPVDVTANFATVYPHDHSVVLNSPLNSPGLTATVTRIGNSDTLHFEITNLKVIVNAPCGSPLSIKTDIWGSNSNAPDPKAQCYICGLSQSFGEVSISLQKSCATVPFQYALTLNSSAQFHVVFRLYADDLDGVREPGGDDSLLFVSDTVVLTPGSFSTGLTNLPGIFCCTEPFSLWGLYVQVAAREFSNVITSAIIEEPCATILPVSLRSFTAVRNNSTVLLKWETVTEENSRGFYIERNLGNNTWQTLGFVSTKAIRGNSTSSLDYEYSDISNTAKGITQYRLRQVDIDGKHAYSPIRAIRAGSQKGKTIVYPNPSSDGRVNVVFADVNTIRDVSLMDMNGRVMKQWKGVGNNNIQIDNLMAGFYTIRIIDTNTGEQTVEKIVVKKR